MMQALYYNSLQLPDKAAQLVRSREGRVEGVEYV